MSSRLLTALVFVLITSFASAEDGYRLWLRYERIADDGLRTAYAGTRIVLTTPAGAESPTLATARDELKTGWRGLTGSEVTIAVEKTAADPARGDEGYTLRTTRQNGGTTVTISGNRDIGVLYGAFALLREAQLQRPLATLNVTSAPKIQRRMLNHWDNLNRSVERGYAGQSLWDWPKLPGELSPRYRDYARANASIGINGIVPVNVNANATFLTAEYLSKFAALADVLRPYGIKLYLTARFSAPVEIGGLKTADPLDPGVIKWWTDKSAEIFKLIPDFGGFLVKANSEGQPGPQAYNRTHADGANLLADAVAPRGGIVIWRAFVYDDKVPDDRHKQAVNEFKPLDGKFRDNVVVQVKNGAIDFMPREPFHPLFGVMPKTPLALELQITQEYTGGSSQLAFLAPMWREVLDADTFRPKKGSTVARVIDGGSEGHRISVIAGVANTGTDRNWSGNQLAPSNWYAFGRLAWDHSLSSAAIAEEWTRQTFSPDARAVRPVVAMLLASREAMVNFSMPLGLHHIMARSHHQGPGPWVAGGSRPDWTSLYYHRADEKGVGFDRTAKGSDALGQYAPEVAKVWSDLATCPDDLLLWFHHLPWDYKMRSGKTLWDEICLHYQKGIDEVRAWQKSWDALAGTIDQERFVQVQALLRGQEREARIWRDACIQYFATFSKLPLPAGYEKPEHPLEYYQSNPVPFALPKP
ncbi:MAG: alpha-glucuronidase family glycosyl hydrolase [Opitutaceae bacterium]